MKYLSFVYLLLAFIAKEGGGETVVSLAPLQTQATQTNDDVYEAVLRYQIASWELAADSYCVKIQGEDADKNFLARIYPLRVKGASGCGRKIHFAWAMKIIDKRTKKNAVIFDLGQIHWGKEKTADVEGGYLCATQCMAGGIYHVVWDGSRWKVSSYEIQIQS